MFGYGVRFDGLVCDVMWEWGVCDVGDVCGVGGCDLGCIVGVAITQICHYTSVHSTGLFGVPKYSSECVLSKTARRQARKSM